MSRKRIDSPTNPQIKALVRLKERRQREREGVYLIEGNREIARALQGGVSLREVFVCEALLRDEGRAVLAELEPTLPLTDLSRSAFEKVSYRDNPDGLLAIATVQTQSLTTLTLPERALVLVIDGLEKPGNVGALLRTADGAGLDAVFLTGAGTDIYNPNVIRASMGSVFSLPVVPVAAEELLTFLRSRNFTVVAASPHATAQYWDADYRGATAIVLGTEHEGLGEAWLGGAGVRVAIPMGGLADSLNVATAGALLMYEALRQRQL